MTITGINKLTRVKEHIEVEASELYSVVCYYYEKIAEVVKSILASSRPEIVSDIIKQGVIFYGGASTIVGFEQFMFKKIGLKIKLLENSKPEIFGTGELLKNPDKLKRILKNKFEQPGLISAQQVNYRLAIFIHIAICRIDCIVTQNRYFGCTTKCIPWFA